MMSYRKRFVEWCQRPSRIKIRTYNPRNFIVLIVTFVLLASSGAFVAQRSIPPPPWTVFMPENFEILTITTDTTLTKDYYNTTIVIGADGVTLDGNGHKIIGPGSEIYREEPDRDPVLDPEFSAYNVTVGILLEGRTNVTVKNCYVTGFSVDFFFKGSNGNVLQENTATNSTYGIGLLESSWNSFKANTANHNGVGFMVDMKQGEIEKEEIFSEGNSFEANTANNNGIGFMLMMSDGNSFKANTANHNDVEGFFIDESNGNSFEANTANHNAYFGFWSSYTSNNTFRENTANYNTDGRAFFFSVSFWNIIQGNTANHNSVGFDLSESMGNILRGNLVNNNTHAGFHITFSSSNNTLTANIVSNNEYGICYGKTDENYNNSNNRIYHNNFVNNVQHVTIQNSVNTWDDGYPSGGNYWSDYAGVDGDGDGIGDTPYVINHNNMDQFPLMTPMNMGT